MSAENETLLEFPCEFPIKVFGKSADDFRELVTQLVVGHLDDSGYLITEKPSRGGRYTALTVTITATSKKQLDAIYLALSSHERVIMVL